MNAKTALLDLFFPPKCAFCGRVGVHGTCASCEKTLPRLIEELSKISAVCRTMLSLASLPRHFGITSPKVSTNKVVRPVAIAAP